MATEIQPVPEAVLASDFPTTADRQAGEWNRKAREWADSENAMATRTREIANVTRNNANAARDHAITASQKAVESADWAMHSQAAADQAFDAKTSTESIAAAFQNNSGLPSLSENRGKALVVRQDESGVEWGTGANLFTGPAIDAPTQVASGAEVSVTLTAASLLNGGSVDRFLIHWWDGVEEEVEAIAGSITAPHEAAGAIGTRLSYWVEAVDSVGNRSGRAYAHVDIVASYALDGAVAVSAPDSVMRESSDNEISFSGVTSPFGAVTYSIVDPGAFTFSKLNGITAGEVITFAAPNVINQTTSTIQVQAIDGLGGESAIEGKTITITVAQVIGVALLQPGGNGGIWAHIDANGSVVANPGTAYFNSHPVWGGIQDVTIDGQHMRKIPKFYAKRGTVNIVPYSGTLPAWWISDQPAAGFELYPAFYDKGAEIEQIYIGKYQASMTGAKLDSKPGVLPTVSRTIGQFISDANARNVGGVSGFMLWSVYHHAAIQWLYLVENATMDSQAKTGQGRVSASSAANVDASDVAQATYRGIVGLWGNVRQWMDGLKTMGGAIHVWDREGNKSWINTGRRRTTAAGTTIYPTTFMDQSGPNYNFADVFIGDTGPTTNTNATAPDYQYFKEDSEYFPSVGGDWSTAAGAGLWLVHCSDAAPNSYSTVGSRLAKV